MSIIHHHGGSYSLINTSFTIIFQLFCNFCPTAVRSNAVQSTQVQSESFFTSNFPRLYRYLTSFLTIACKSIIEACDKGTT